MKFRLVTYAYGRLADQLSVGRDSIALRVQVVSRCVMHTVKMGKAVFKSCRASENAMFLRF